MAEKVNQLQDMFLNATRRSKAPVTMFLMKGVKLQGIITWFDNFSVLLRRDGQTQLVYKHAISTIQPYGAIELAELPPASGEGGKTKLLQEVFLVAARESGDPVTMFLVNGVMLQGRIMAHDLFSLVLEREGQLQLVYKHAISTIQPAHALYLGGADSEDENPEH